MNYKIPEKLYEDSSIKLFRHKTNSTLEKVRGIIKKTFCETEKYYSTISTDEYRDVMLGAQNILNKGDGIGREIIGEMESEVFEYFACDKILIQSNIYLRASRPNLMPETENIGWHRETFYGANMEKSVNCWTPVSGVDEFNSLQFIPKSQNIRDEDIIIESNDSKFTKQFSVGHKLGFQYKPKKIISGVDFSSPCRMLVDYGSSALFSGNLIHGAAENRSNTIRFSIDFRILKKSDYSASEAKQKHFSSNKPYFVEY